MKKLFIYSLFLVLSLLYWSCSKDSNPVNNTLSDKPTVEIISPANNSDVSDTTTILVNASDDKGVTRVEIFIDDSLVTKLFNAPYKYVWDTRLLKDSTNHSIYARVYDTDSNMVGSKIVKVTNYFLSPTNLKATQIADGTILLTWNDNSKVETGYEVEQSINGSTFTKIHTLGASITKDTIYSLIRDTNYSYRVRATSNYKLSKYSESSTVRIILNAPTNLIISVFADTLSVSWLNNSYLNSIDIEMSTDSTNYVKINTLSYSINFIKVVVNLAPNNKYFFRLKGAGKYNSSLYSSVGRFQCILDAPTNLTYLFYDDTKIKLTWQDNSNCESGFEIEKSTDNLSFTKITDLTANVTTVDILGTYFLGTNYYYRVRAKNNNNSVYSNTALATVVLNAPSNLNS